jgi:hypothetical protein
MAAWGLLAATAAMAALMAGSVCSLAQAQSAPATQPAPFIQPVPEPVVPATKPAEAPYIQPVPESAIGPAPKPPAGPFIKPTTRATSQPAPSTSSGQATLPAGGAVTQPAGAAPKVDEPKTLGFSAWVAVERGSRCVDLSKMPADVRELWQKHCTTRGRVLAERAARAAAIAQLTGRVGDLAIGPDLTVRKFLSATDQPDAGTELFLRGAAVRAVRYRTDALVAEVEMEIRPRTLLASLKGWARSHVNGNRDPMAQLENALLQPDDTPLLQTGQAAVPAEEILAPTPDLLKATQAATQPAAPPDGAMTPPAGPMKEPATSTTVPATTQSATPATTQPATRAMVPAR